MPKSLNLEQLRIRARELLRAVQANEAHAIARVAKALPHVAAASLKLAQAQTVVARENRLASWPKMKAALEKGRERLRLRSARRAIIERTVAEILAKARTGDAAALTRVVPLGKDAGAEVVAAISANPSDLEMVVQAYIDGLQHPNPKVRHECAHALDSYGHPKALEPLIALSYDPVPRVRWMALHALSCDACKEARPAAPKALERATELALHDSSVQVRRHATVAVAQLGGAAARGILEQIVRADQDEVVRRNAKEMLQRLAK